MTTEQAESAKIFRKNALAFRSENKDKVRMSLAAKVKFCEYRDLPPYGDVSLTFYVRTNSQKDFFSLFKEQDLKFSEAAIKARKEKTIYCD